MKHGFVIDLDRCIGCKGCQVACKQENGVALGANRTLVRTVGPMGSYPDVQMYFLPTPCQQCADPGGGRGAHRPGAVHWLPQLRGGLPLPGQYV